MHLYLHIPFCKQACHYCDFHFSTNVSQQETLVDALCREIALQKNYLPSTQLDTVYWGGGTPSILTESQISRVFDTIAQHFSLRTDAEITLEANPDDLNKQKIKSLYQQGINRLSIGVQSFHDAHLQYLNRVHNAQEATICIKNAQDIGIENISLDLIYAIPATSHYILEQDLAQAIALNIPHISAYCLTIEPQTVFGNWLSKQKIPAIDEESASQQFELLTHTLAQQGWEQYEISNFAKSQRYSKHNSSYWQQAAYLGIGPSAHSFDGDSRQYNVAHNTQYVKAIQQGVVPYQRETLSPSDKVNEYLLTGLRTKWGCDLTKLETLLGYRMSDFYPQKIQKLIEINWIQIENNVITLTQAGKLFADRIASDLFV